MREILFRGQTRRKGEKVWLDGSPVDSNWVYGGIFPNNDGGDFAIIYQQEPEIHKFPVYADTTGQYTGLTDKNGKKIFEGDIVRMERGLMANGEYAYCDVCKVIYDHCCFFVVFADGCRRTRLYREGGTERYEIIGNIHDNPELIGGEK